MALKQDERALLQLVCERGQSYEDLAGLLAISEDEVRAKARHALTELGGADPDAEVGLTDYLLGQADPIGRADAVRHLQQDAEARELATTIATKLEAIAPSATLPAIPEPRGRKRKAAAPAATSPRADAPAAAPPVAGAAREHHARRRHRPRRQTRLIAGLGAGGLILIFAILAIAGVFSGSGGSDDDHDQAAAAQQRDITPVKLKRSAAAASPARPTSGSPTTSSYVDLKLERARPEASKGNGLRVWLMLNDKPATRSTSLQPDENGSVLEHVPRADAGAVARRQPGAVRADLGRAREGSSQANIKQAVKAAAPVVPVPGDALAKGDIPLAEGRRPGGRRQRCAGPASDRRAPATTHDDAGRLTPPRLSSRAACRGS